MLFALRVACTWIRYSATIDNAIKTKTSCQPHWCPLTILSAYEIKKPEDRLCRNVLHLSKCVACQRNFSNVSKIWFLMLLLIHGKTDSFRSGKGCQHRSFRCTTLQMNGSECVPSVANNSECSGDCNKTPWRADMMWKILYLRVCAQRINIKQ